ncbi:MAG: hypothetical protein WD690_20635 [Vicinamibacterales bacterium]
MAEFQVRSDAVDVEHIMRQIRQRIREKRGVDYTEEELETLATVKLEKFLDPEGLRSDLVRQFRDTHPPEATPPNFAFEDTTLYETHRGIIRAIRRLLNPILKLFFNPNPIVDALHIQATLNERNAAFQARQLGLQSLQYEVMHNLVMELTRAGIEIRNLKMRLDSIAGRLDFDERRQRAFEGVVQYRKPQAAAAQPAAAAEGQTAAGPTAAEGDDGAQRSRRRRRRRRRVPSAGMPPGAGNAPPNEGSAGGGEGGGGEGPSE